MSQGLGAMFNKSITFDKSINEQMKSLSISEAIVRVVVDFNLPNQILPGLDINDQSHHGRLIKIASLS